VWCCIATSPLPAPDPIPVSEPGPEPDPVATSDPDPVPDPVPVADPDPAADPDPDPVTTADPDPLPVPVVGCVFLHAGAPITARARSIIAERMQYPPCGMLRCFGRRFIFVVLAIAPAIAAANPPITLPPGTRAEAEHFLSGRGPRDTTDFISRQLAHAGISAAQIGPYRVRGVDVTRFVAGDPAAPFLAIHVLRISGKTLIFFVPRPKP
jgi:hypothetical protein